MDHDWAKIVFDSPDDEVTSAINFGMALEICRNCGFARQYIGKVVVTKNISCDEISQIKDSHSWLSPEDGIVSFARSLINNKSISVKDSPILEMLVGDVDPGEVGRALDRIKKSFTHCTKCGLSGQYHLIDGEWVLNISQHEKCNMVLMKKALG